MLRVGFPSTPCLCLSYPSLCGTFIANGAEAIQSVLNSPLEGTVLYVDVDLVCLWEVNSGPSYATILDGPP